MGYLLVNQFYLLWLTPAPILVQCQLPSESGTLEEGSKRFWGMDMVMLGGKAITRSLKQILSSTVLEIMCCILLIFYYSLCCAVSHSLWKIFLSSVSFRDSFFSLWVFYISHPQLVLKGFFFFCSLSIPFYSSFLSIYSYSRTLCSSHKG